MRRQRKKWESPYKRWDKRRIIEERKILKTYCLKNKRELRRAQYELRRIRRIARYLLSHYDEERVNEFLGRLKRLGLVPENVTLDDVLSLTVHDVLERRLQTVVWRKGLALTPCQARQLIVHGHVYIGEQRVTVPSYWVKKDEENLIRVPEHILQKVRG